MVHCAVPSVDGASLITMDSLKTGGNAGLKNPEKKQFKKPFPVGEERENQKCSASFTSLKLDS